MSGAWATNFGRRLPLRKGGAWEHFSGPRLAQLMVLFQLGFPPCQRDVGLNV